MYEREQPYLIHQSLLTEYEQYITWLKPASNLIMPWINTTIRFVLLHHRVAQTGCRDGYHQPQGALSRPRPDYGLKWVTFQILIECVFVVLHFKIYCIWGFFFCVWSQCNLQSLQRLFVCMCVSMLILCMCRSLNGSSMVFVCLYYSYQWRVR